MPAKIQIGFSLFKPDNEGEAPTMTINVYERPASQPGVSGILEKYRIPWRHGGRASFLEGVARAFDVFGVFKPKACLPSLRSRRKSGAHATVEHSGGAGLEGGR